MFKLFKNLTKKDRLYVVICIILIVFQVWLELKMPDYMSEITRLVQTEGSKMKDIIEQGAYMLLCAGGSLISAVVVGYFAAQVASSFSANIRLKIFKKIQEFGIQEMKKFQTSSLITRTTNDVNQVEMLIGMGLQVMAKAPIMAVWAIMKILNKGVEWSILTAVCVVVLLITVGILMAIVLPKFSIVQKLIDKINGVTRENLTGIRVIRAFNAEKYQANRFEKVNNELTKTQMFNQRCLSVMMPVMNLVMHSLTLGIYIIGAILINEVLDEDIAIKNGNFKGKTKEVGTIEFKNVSFKYPDADDYLLEDISFKAKKGDTIAFIGSTGSGKSTLINLIPRFYDATDGEVLVDGVNVKEYDETALHNKIGYISQKAIMFTGTVKENVSYGNNGKKKPTDEEIRKAIEVAQGTEFVEKMDGKYDAHIARGGTNVSGGQKQRLSIARAIARDPEIYIFDDSFSALDYKTDATLRKELKKYTKDATSVIVAQRIGTIINADKIIVLDKGRCVGQGTHKELLKKCKVYKEIALSQLSEEELNNA